MENTSGIVYFILRKFMIWSSMPNWTVRRGRFVSLLYSPE